MPANGAQTPCRPSRRPRGATRPPAAVRTRPSCAAVAPRAPGGVAIRAVAAGGGARPGRPDRRVLRRRAAAPVSLGAALLLAPLLGMLALLPAARAARLDTRQLQQTKAA